MECGCAADVDAEFTVEEARGDCVIIRDCDRIGRKSVTNDAHAVCEHLYALYGDRRFFYWDTIGRCDELVHEHGRFKYFKPGRI